MTVGEEKNPYRRERHPKVSDERRTQLTADAVDTLPITNSERDVPPVDILKPLSEDVSLFPLL